MTPPIPCDILLRAGTVVPGDDTGGALVLDAGRPCRFDATEGIAAAQAVAERLWQQAGRA